MMLSMLPTDTGDAPLAWLFASVVIAALAALVFAVLIGLLIRRVCRRWPIAVEATRRGRIPFRLLLVLIAVRQVVASTTVLGDWQETLVTVLQLAILAVCGWILAVVAFVAEELTLARFPIDVPTTGAPAGFAPRSRCCAGSRSPPSSPWSSPRCC